MSPAPSARNPILSGTLKRLVLLAVLACVTMPNSGCKLLFGFTNLAFTASNFWYTTPLIPVTPYMSQQIEDTYWEEERYGQVPILDPVEGENAPLFCLDPPSADEIVRALPDATSGGVPFLAETKRNNMRMITELIVDRVDECRFFPMAGPARQHHCHWKCTVWFEETKQSWWPVPFTFTEDRQEVVYIDHNHLIRCAGPVVE
ncbi:MAG: hypothetical protein ACC652_14190 [Acidimicrobiales bacterium]